MPTERWVAFCWDPDPASLLGPSRQSDARRMKLVESNSQVGLPNSPQSAPMWARFDLTRRMLAEEQVLALPDGIDALVVAAYNSAKALQHDFQLAPADHLPARCPRLRPRSGSGYIEGEVRAGKRAATDVLASL
jgi:hypothetical protein